MEPGIHELTAGYALDALDPEERRAYEEHLRRLRPLPRRAVVLLGGDGLARARGDRPGAGS